MISIDGVGCVGPGKGWKRCWGEGDHEKGTDAEVEEDKDPAANGDRESSGEKPEEGSWIQVRLKSAHAIRHSNTRTR